MATSANKLIPVFRDSNKPMNKLIFSIFALISGAMVVISFPDYYQHYFVWFALVPLMYAITVSGNRGSFLYGTITGLVIYLWGFWWVTHSMIHFGGMHVLLAIFCLILFSIYHCLLYGFFAYISRKLLDKNLPELFVFPSVYTFLAFIFPTLFPWSLANAQIENSCFSQVADITGASFLNIPVLLSNTAILSLILHLKKKRYRKPLFNFLAVALLIFLIHVYGWGRLHSWQNAEPSKKVKVAILQGNLGIDMLGRRDFKRRSFDVYERLTKLYKNYDLIVWPESSVPLSYTINTKYRKQMDALAESVNSNIIFGSYDIRWEDGVRKGYSTAFLIGPGKKYQVYDKIKLLPFGDYMPLDNIFPFLRKFVVGVGDWIPGSAPKVMKANGFKIAPSICYEILIPSLNRKLKNLGADFIVNMTNDAWFGHTKESYQHMGLGRFRAIELRLPIVRSTNTGVSAFITATGKIVTSIRQNLEATISWEMRIKPMYSFYAAHGNLILYLYFTACGFFIAKAYFFRKKQP